MMFSLCCLYHRGCHPWILTITGASKWTNVQTSCLLHTTLEECAVQLLRLTMPLQAFPVPHTHLFPFLFIIIIASFALVMELVVMDVVISRGFPTQMLIRNWPVDLQYGHSILCTSAIPWDSTTVLFCDWSPSYSLKGRPWEVVGNRSSHLLLRFHKTSFW